MGAVPRNRARQYPPPPPKPPALIPAGAEVPGWARGFVSDPAEEVEHRTADGRVVARCSVADHVPVILPTTGLAGRLANDPAVRELLWQEADRLHHKATRLHPPPVIGLSGTGSAATRRARAAEWTYSPADAGWFDIVVEAPFAAAGRYWEWNKRAFARLAGWPLVWLFLVGGAGVGVGTLVPWTPARVGAWAGVVIVDVVLAYRVLRDPAEPDDTAMVAELVAGVADRHPAGFTFRDVPVEAYTPVCVCPNCDTLALHWFAAADRVPEHTAAELPDKPVVWRDCAGVGCGFVWAQYA